MIILPTIICGGMGTRLWPISRECFPKPLIKLADGESMLQKTFMRALALTNITEIITVTNLDTYFLANDELKLANRSSIPHNFLLEPCGRNTAAAIAAAACWVERVYGGNAIMLILPADHLIEPPEILQALVEKAITAANQGKLITFGIKPSAPETGYGYIEYIQNEMVSPGVFSVARFIEKPSPALAEEYSKRENHLWNSGMFCFKASTILKEFEQYADFVLELVRESIRYSVSTRIDGHLAVKFATDYFSRVPNISIDYAVLEKSKNIAVVPGEIKWNDIGSWAAISKLIDADIHGNRINGEVHLHNTKNCYIHASDRVLSAVGVEDLIIVDTPDALLVTNSNCSQDVKYIVSQLKNRNHYSYKTHRTVARPWGSFTILDEGSGFKVKKLLIKPLSSLSLQTHRHRNEHWIIVSGVAEVITGESKISLSVNQAIYIPAGVKHRLFNNDENEPLILIEVQWGEYLGEDDIVRLEDQYFRATV